MLLTVYLKIILAWLRYRCDLHETNKMVFTSQPIVPWASNVIWSKMLNLQPTFMHCFDKEPPCNLFCTVHCGFSRDSVFTIKLSPTDQALSWLSPQAPKGWNWNTINYPLSKLLRQWLIGAPQLTLNKLVVFARKSKYRLKQNSPRKNTRGFGQFFNDTSTDTASTICWRLYRLSPLE